MYCHKCELPYDANARFCDVCGLPLSLKEAPPQFGGSPSYPASAISNPPKKPEELKGLGGWLILLGIALVVGLVYRSFVVLRFVTLFTKGTVRFASDPHSAGYIPGYTGIMDFEIGAHIAFLAFNILLAILFAKESRAFPRCFLAFLGLSVIFAGVDHWIFSRAISGSSLQLQQRLQPAIQRAILSILPAAIGSAIWALYVTQSRRVKATFVK
jgi:hypothetical protein